MQDRSLSAPIDAPPSADGSVRDDSISDDSIPPEAPASKVRSRLFFKYVVLFVAVVCVALVANGIFDVYFYYQEHKAALVRIQREQAAAAADKIGHFIKEIESQLGWTTQLPWSAGSIEQRRFDALRLLRQVPAITELTQLDATGKERLRVSRLAMDVVGSSSDFANDPKFTEAVAKKVYYGPVYFRRESEPYMTLAIAGARRDAGVSVAEVNLKFIWDVVSQIRVGERGQAYVVDGQGRLIAHPDISLVLRNTDMSRLPQIQAALAAAQAGPADQVQLASDLRGRDVLTAHATVAPLGWHVLVELPTSEAYAPLYEAVKRSGLLLLGGLALAILAGVFLARHMVVPIQALRVGAARIGGGDLGQRIAIRTGDELEGLANQFNDMAGKLQESYADLENKVELRTRELTESLEQQTATSDVLRVISSSPGDLQPVFESMLENATRICEAKIGILFRYENGSYSVIAMLGVPPAYAEYLNRGPIMAGPETGLGRIAIVPQTVHVVDAQAEKLYVDREPWRVATVELGGVRSLLNVPMLKEGELIGAIGIYRQEVRPFSGKQIELVTNFANQAVIAIENVRLLHELRTRTAELARSVEELRALGEVSHAVNSSLDLTTVLSTIVAKAVQLSATEAGTIYTFNEASQEFELRATYGMDEALIAAIRNRHILISDLAIGDAAKQRAPVQLPDLSADTSATIDIIVRAGYRALLVVPLLSAEQIVGALVVRRKAPGEFPQASIDLLQTFAAQSVLAIENARLFQEIEDKSRQLEIASQHKSQFLANMSHELRTPLNAILGYSELILDDIYGAAPDKMRAALQRVQSNGKHLLGLINDVLDLSKIEAGQLTLSVADYSIKDVVQNVFTAVESLATEKKIALKIELPPNLPVAQGDERRLTQVLLNLVGNAIKFTDTGEVAIKAATSNGSYTVSVRDTGPGIDKANQSKIFEEFQQADNSATKKKGGTGLGLAIAKRIVEMHGGYIWVESKPGEGATFSFSVPLQVEQQVLRA
jgi:signal transduction histidine kinase